MTLLWLWFWWLAVTTVLRLLYLAFGPYPRELDVERWTDVFSLAFEVAIAYWLWTGYLK